MYTKPSPSSSEVHLHYSKSTWESVQQDPAPEDQHKQLPCSYSTDCRVLQISVLREMGSIFLLVLLFIFYYYFAFICLFFQFLLFIIIIIIIYIYI